MHILNLPLFLVYILTNDLFFITISINSLILIIKKYSFNYWYNNYNRLTGVLYFLMIYKEFITEFSIYSKIELMSYILSHLIIYNS